jgi:hypothetical protein
MKSNYTQKFGIALTAVALFLSSCGSNATFSKRYHNRGFNIAWGGGSDATPAKPVAKKARIEAEKSAIVENSSIEIKAEEIASYMAPLSPVTGANNPAEILKKGTNSENLQTTHRLNLGVLTSTPPVMNLNEPVTNLRKQIKNSSALLKKGTASNSSSDDSPIFGILSLVFGILGLVIFPLLFGVAAIVLGWIGRDKSMNGLAYAGLILGILEVLIIVLLLGLLLAVM